MTAPPPDLETDSEYFKRTNGRRLLASFS